MSERDNSILLVYTDIFMYIFLDICLFSSIKALFRAYLTKYIDFLCTFL